MVVRPLALQPLHGLGQHETPQAAVQWLQLQAAVAADAHPPLKVVDPHIQLVLLLAHLLPGQADFHAQQAVRLVVALGMAELDETQRPCAAVAVGGQRRQAQQLKVFYCQVSPGQRWAVRGLRLFGRLYGGGGIGHQGVLTYKPIPSLSAVSPRT
ncbi:hypothetical protein D3C81_1423590 [compost metagenome]